MRNTSLMEYIAEHIDPNLMSRVREWFINNSIDVYWNYNDGLSESQVDMLLNGDHYGFTDEIWENLTMSEWMYEAEIEKARECVAEYLTEILGGITVDEEDVDEDDVDEMIDHLELRSEIITNMNVDQLARNTRVRITLDLDLEHEHRPQDDYEAAEPILDFFNINPRSIWLLMYGSHEEYYPDGEEPWPNIPERDGNEYVYPHKLYQSWVNMFYHGCYVALLGGLMDPLTLAYAVEESKSDGKYLEVVLPPDTPLNTHDYLNGSGGMFFYLNREMRVRITSDNQMARDGAYGYGIDAVHDLVSSMWETELNVEVKEIENEHACQDVPNMAL